MVRLRERLTYANVVSTLALFLVVAGGAAWAARVPKKSVGPRQLKANAVTTAKIKANAVTTRKIRRNAVGTGKIKNGAIESQKIYNGTVAFEDLDQSTIPYARVVNRAQGRSELTLGPKVDEYPLAGASYYQEAGENDSFLGALDVFFGPECAPPRTATAYLLLDSQDPLEFDPEDVVAHGSVGDDGEGAVVRRIELGPSGAAAPTRFEPTTNTLRRLSLVASAECTAGAGVSAIFGAANVTGVR
jgi:hypothetical protein